MRFSRIRISRGKATIRRGGTTSKSKGETKPWCDSECSGGGKKGDEKKKKKNVSVGKGSPHRWGSRGKKKTGVVMILLQKGSGGPSNQFEIGTVKKKKVYRTWQIRGGVRGEQTIKRRGGRGEKKNESETGLERRKGMLKEGHL